MESPPTAMGGAARPPRDRLPRADVARQLDHLTRAFAESRSRTESDFLELAHTLRDLYSTARGLAALIGSRAGALRNVLAESRVTGDQGLAAQSLDELRAGLQETAGLVQNLGTIEASLGQLAKQVASIKRTGSILTYLVLGFSVESSRSAECLRCFSSFVEDLRGVTARISQLWKHISDQIEATQSSQAEALKTMSGRLEEMHKLGDTLEVTALKTAAEAQALLDAALNVLQLAERRADQTARDADDAVYQLQFGDIIRQKFEHIEAALIQAAEGLSSEDPTEAPHDSADKVDCIIVVQVSQLEAVKAEVLAAKDKLAASFQSIAEETNLLAGDLRGWRNASQNPGARVGDPLGLFRESLLRVEELHQRGCALRAEGRRAASLAVEASSSLATHLGEVREVNRDMHLLALNSTIKTQALGRQGDALEVLSAEVDGLVRECNREVPKVIVLLEKILSDVRKSVPTPQSAGEAVEPANADRGLKDKLEGVSRAYEEFCQLEESAANMTQKQRELLAGGQAGLEFLAGLAEAITEQSCHLAAMRERLAPWKTKGAVLEKDALEAMGRGYTMHSEREVLGRALAASGLSAASPSNARVPELPNGPASVLTVGGREPVPCLAPLADARARSVPVESAKPTDPSLGDNVELF